MQWEGRGHEQTARTNTQVWIVAAVRNREIEHITSAEAGAAWSGPGRRGGSRAAVMALMTRRAAPRTGRGRRGARRRGPGEDAEVRGGAGRAGEDDDEAWGRPA